MSKETPTEPPKKAKLMDNQTRDNYLNIAWLNFLGSGNLEIEMYHLILSNWNLIFLKYLTKGI